MESERPRTALVGNSPIFVDQINSIRPTRVFLFGSVVETVDQRWKFDTELTNTHSRHFLALAKGFRTGKNYFVADIALHLPNVAGVGFEDVHRVKRHTRSVVVVKLVEGRNLPPEWRSGVAAKDEDDGFVVANRSQGRLRAVIEAGQGK